MKKPAEEVALNKWWRGLVKNQEEVCEQNFCEQCLEKREAFLAGFRAAKRNVKK